MFCFTSKQFVIEGKKNPEQDYAKRTVGPKSKAEHIKECLRYDLFKIENEIVIGRDTVKVNESEYDH